MKDSTKTEFKNVYKIISSGKYIRFRYSLMKDYHLLRANNFLTAREAAIALDKKLIDMNMEPINIFIKK